MIHPALPFLITAILAGAIRIIRRDRVDQPADFLKPGVLAMWMPLLVSLSLIALWP